MPPLKVIALAIIVIAAGLSLLIFVTNPGLTNAIRDLKNSDTDGPFELNETMLNSMVNKSPFFVLDVYYPGCAVCEIINGTVTELSTELGNQVTFGRINIRENKGVVRKYKISSYPTLLLFSEGVLVDRLKGNVSKKFLVTELKSIEPKLDTSKVKTKAVPPTKNVTGAAVPLTRVGEKNPTLPLLVTDINLDQAIKNYPFLVVDMGAEWCGACHTMNITISELAKELRGQVAFGLINGPENNKTKQKYNITAYPTLLVFRNGELKDKLIGNRAKSVFISYLNKQEPKLDISKVKLPTTRPAAATPSPPREIPLAKLGEKNPSLPMLANDSNIENAVKNYPFLVLEGFADWCGFCRMMNVTISELATELKGQVAFGLIDAQKNNETRQKYNITSYPTILIFKNGVLADTIIGNQDKTAFVSALKKLESTLDTSKVKFPPPLKPVASPQPKITPEEACTKMNKSENPVLEAYIVSRCPFGLQMQRIMYNVITKLPQAAANINVRYIGSVADGNITSMHGEIEAQENLRQICIRDEQSSKYWDYVSCYMKENKSDECLDSESIDKVKLQGCIDDSGRGIAYAKKDFDLVDSYGITGSPTLMMNNEKVSEFNFATNETNGRSPEAVKNLLCCGFKTKPPVCSTILNASRAATMFAP
jgi:thioredoxin 1